MSNKNKKIIEKYKKDREIEKKKLLKDFKNKLKEERKKFKS